MKTELEKAQETLYGKGGLRATNLKLFPGSNRDATAEQMAAQINATLSDLLIDTPANDALEVLED